MNKDMKIGNFQLMFGDCLKRMKEIPDNSIDMILCDLPYGVLNKSNQSAKWDSVVDFGKLWEQYKRITKQNGAIVLFGQGIFTARLIMSNQSWWKYNLIWNKILKSGFLNANRQPLRQHEDICIFCNGRTPYNPQMVPCDPKHRNHRRHKIGSELNENIKNRCYGNFGNVEDEITNVKFPTSIISIPKAHIKGKCYHPTQKSVALLEYLIKTYTDEEMLVLDNCMGSGSTGVACVNTNRKFIGIELDEKYYDISCNRIKDAIREKKQSLFK